MGKTKREGAWTHESGDVKADPEKAEGVNVLPDGNVALTKSFIEDMYEATQAHQSESDESES